MNLSLDGYVAAPGDDLGWSLPSDELFQWWSDRVGATGLALYGRRLWETMSPHWPTADQQPGATPAQIEFARRWRDMPKVVFSSTTTAVDGSARLVTGDAVAEITRLKAEDGGPMDVGGATLAAAAMPAGLIDEYAIVTHPVLRGRRHAVLHGPGGLGELNLVETRAFPDGVLLTRTRRYDRLDALNRQAHSCLRRARRAHGGPRSNRRRCRDIHRSGQSPIGRRHADDGSAAEQAYIFSGLAKGRDLTRWQTGKALRTTLQAATGPGGHPPPSSAQPPPPQRGLAGVIYIGLSTSQTA